MRTQREVLFCLLNIALSLCAGGYIYVSYGSGTAIGEFLSNVLQMEQRLPDGGLTLFLRNWGADFLWAYALFFSLYLCYAARKWAVRTAIAVSAVVCLTLEMLQLMPASLLTSTFDILDIAAEMLGICLGAFVFHLKRSHYEDRGGVGDE